MNEEHYHVVFRGEIQQGQSVQDVAQRLISMFALKSQSLEQVFADRQPLMVKEHVSYEEALKYKSAFERVGTICHIEPVQMQKSTISQASRSPHTPDQERLYHVVFSGKIAAGHDIEQVKQQLAQLFKTDRARIDKLFTGKPVRIRENLSHQAALQYQKVFERAGAICSIEPVEEQTIQVQPEQTRSASQPPSLAKKQNIPEPALAPIVDVSSIINQYRSQVKNRDILRLAPRIPTETLVLANKTYAYAFNRHTEKSFAVIDLVALGYGLLLTEKRLYLYEKPHKPLNFKLSDLQSIEIRNTNLYINAREVMSIPPEISKEMPVLVNLIRQVADFYVQHPGKTRETSVASVQPDELPSTPSRGKKWLFAFAGALFVIAIAIVGYFQLRGPVLPQEAVIKTLVREFTRDERITVNLVSVGQIGKFDSQQNSVMVQVSVSGQCNNMMLLKDLELQLAVDNDGEWSIASPQLFAFEYLLCPLSDQEIAAVLDVEIEKELKYVRRAYTKEDKVLLAPINALLLVIGIKVPALKQITVKYKYEGNYTQKIDGIETNFAYQNFSDVEIFLSRDQEGNWTIGGMETLKELDKTMQDFIKSIEERATRLKR